MCRFLIGRPIPAIKQFEAKKSAPMNDAESREGFFMLVYVCRILYTAILYFPNNDRKKFTKNSHCLFSFYQEDGSAPILYQGILANNFNILGDFLFSSSRQTQRAQKPVSYDPKYIPFAQNCSDDIEPSTSYKI